MPYFSDTHAAYATALGLCENRAEKAFLLRRLAEVGAA
jgi:hypothetical protein